MHLVRLAGRLALLIAAVPLVLSVAYWVIDPVSTLMLGRRLTGQPVVRQWVPMERISPALVRAVLASEDASYCRHLGVDLGELVLAVRRADDLEDARGASTIPMQAAKNLFLWPGRSFIRKALEMPLAVWLDLVLSKRRLLEIYLNIAQWGPHGEFGIEAGARRAFAIPAAALNAEQAALMAVMLPNPIRRSAARPSALVRRLAARLASRVPKEGAALTACLGRLGPDADETRSALIAPRAGGTRDDPMRPR